MTKGITFRGKHSFKDFELVMEFFEDLGANQKVIRDEVPFMNGSYDFSTVGSLGDNVYTNRAMRARFGYKSYNKAALRIKYDQVVSWLLDGPPAELIDDNQPDLNYVAKVEQYPSKEEFLRIGKLTVYFIADSFKKGVNLEGSESIPWDTFNFEIDYLAPTQFDVNGTQIITLYNSGRIVTPEVIVSSDMQCTLNGYTATFTTAKKKDWYFRLKHGENQITVTGSGAIKFNWRKEML